MKNLVCFLEEPSAKEMLEGVLPRLLPADVKFTYIVFEGKQDLKKAACSQVAELDESEFRVLGNARPRFCRLPCCKRTVS